MATQLDINSLFQQLELPKQDIDFLPFCGSDKTAKVIEWTNSLKSTQALITCNQIYNAIPQVLRMKTPHGERKLMLDALFTVSYPAVTGLAKEFLNQPLSLPVQAQNAAIIGQSILKHLVTGYLVCLRDLADEKKLKPGQITAMTEIAFTALQCLALMQLRNAQLYGQASSIVWQYANAILRLALHFEFTDSLVKSPFDSIQNSTVKDVYLRLMALASARLNQLTQLDMANVFTALESWSRAIKVNTATPTFWIDLSLHQPPTAQSKTPAPDSESIFTADFSALTQQLANLMEGEANLIGSGYEITIPAELNSPTAMHLELAWSKSAERSNHRHSSHHTAEIVIGVTACHSKLSNCEDFSEFTGQTKDKGTYAVPFLSNLFSSLTPADTSKATSSTTNNATIRVTTQNISKDGYCFKWEGQQAIKIDAGDVICIREHAKRTWGLGVIRWIRKYKSYSLLGVELLSSRPTAVAASCHFDDGGYSDLMRAFLLPSIHPLQGPTLLTANIVFKEGAKVKIKSGPKESANQGRLGSCQLTTGRVKAFTLESESVENSQFSASQHQL